MGANLVMIVIGGVLVGLGFGALFPAVQAAAFSAAAPHRVGLATSTFYLMADAGIGLGPLIAGILLPFLGYRGNYLLFTVITTLTAVLFHTVSRQERRCASRPQRSSADGLDG